jgi:hypothetical protein
LFPRRIDARIRMTAAVILCTTAAGCSDSLYLDRRETISYAASDAMKADQVTQMVDPWPAHSNERNIAFNGEKMQTAVERYRTNKVIQPVNATTSSSGYTAQQAPAIPKP